MITTPISPASILKGSPSPVSSTSGTGGKKTSRPPKGFSSPVSNNSASSSSSPSIPPMTPNDQLPQQNIITPSFKGPVIPPPTHFPYFPMNPMTIPNPMMNPMMFATPMNPSMHHMIQTTTPQMFAMPNMFPQPVMPNIPPPTSHPSKIPLPIQPKPSTSPPTTQTNTLKAKPKKKKKAPSASSTNNSVTSSDNSNISSSGKPTKRKTAPSTSLSIHEHIISYLMELGLKDSAKILENDLNNPLLLNASEDRVSSFVQSLSHEIERHSNAILPSTKKIVATNNETITTSNDTEMTETNDNNKYSSEKYLNVLKQTTENQYKPTAEYVNERLENLEQTLGVKEKKVQVFSRIQEMEEQMLKLGVSNEPQPPTQQVELSDDFFENFFENDENKP